MTTKIKDQATAEQAALRLNEGLEVPAKPGEPTTPKHKGSSERLFPDFVKDDVILNRPVKQAEDPPQVLPAAATPKADIQPQMPATQQPTQPVYLTPEEMAGKMVKTKVDGVEKDVPVQDVLKSYQLERLLNSRIESLAEERSRLEMERAAFIKSQQQQQQVTQPQVKPQSQVKKSPEVEALELQLAQMQMTLNQLGQAVAPTLRESGLKRIDQDVRKNLGAEDFMTYAPKIQEFVDGEMLKPEVMANPETQKQLLNSNFWYSKYQEMKLRDMLKAPVQNPTPSNTPVLAATNDGSPVVMNNQGQPVNLPSFEGSGGVPSRTSQDSDWQSTYNSLMQRAKESRSQEDWAAVFRHKFSRA